MKIIQYYSILFNIIQYYSILFNRVLRLDARLTEAQQQQDAAVRGAVEATQWTGTEADAKIAELQKQMMAGDAQVRGASGLGEN